MAKLHAIGCKYMGDFMGLFSRKKRGPFISPEDLRLPDEVETDVRGLVLRKGPAGVEVEIEIVGESYCQDEVRAVVAVAEGGSFDLYLLPDPKNPYDRNAVRVMVGNLHVGFLPRDAAKVWQKRCKDAMERRELIWGEGRAVSRTGEMWGIFGSVWMPPVSSPSDELEPAELDTAGLERARKSIQKVADGPEPDTLAQLKSFAKRAAKASAPLHAHAMWLNITGSLSEKWEEVMHSAESVIDLVAEAEYATDPYEVDVMSPLQDLIDALGKTGA